jgi:hypothetical protein
MINLYKQNKYYHAVPKNQDPLVVENWIITQFKGSNFYKAGSTHAYSLQDFTYIDIRHIPFNPSCLETVNKNINTPRKVTSVSKGDPEFKKEDSDIENFLRDIKSKKYPVVTWDTVFKETVSGPNSGYVFRILSSDYISFDAYSTWRVVGIKEGPLFRYDILFEKPNVSDFSFESKTDPFEDKEKQSFCLFFIHDMESNEKKFLVIPQNEFESFLFYIEHLDMKEYLFKLESEGPNTPSKYSIFSSKVKRPNLLTFSDMDINISDLLSLHFKTRSKSFIFLKIKESKADLACYSYPKPYLLN